jgi:hypothetical protein
VLLIGGILLARRRRRALVISVLCVAGGLVLIGIGLLIGRGIFVDQVTSNAVTSDTAGRVFDTLVRYLRWSIRLLILLGLLVAFGAWIGGSGRLATRLRRGVVRGPHVLGSYLNAGAGGALRGAIRDAAADLRRRHHGPHPAAAGRPVAGNGDPARRDLRGAAPTNRGPARRRAPAPRHRADLGACLRLQQAQLAASAHGFGSRGALQLPIDRGDLGLHRGLAGEGGCSVPPS